MTKEDVLKKAKEFAGENNVIEIPLLEGNLKITMSAELWTEYICQILKIN